MRTAIETLLSALLGEAELSEGLTLQLAPSITMSLSRSDRKREAVIAFDPPPEVHVRRGPIHLRCTLTALVLTPEQVHAKLDGWFDRRWQVVS